MNKSIKYSILLSLIFFTNIIYSQDLSKYKNVYPYVLAEDTILAYEILKEYQEKDPFHANTYYQLGLISQFWSNKYDALTQSKDVNFFIYHTKLYLDLSKKYIDDKEVRKNRVYYQGVKSADGKKIKLEDVISEINNRLEINSKAKLNVTSIQHNYIRSVDFYNKSVELFLDINRNNNNYKELLLTADNQILNKINKLGLMYDSTIYHLTKFEKEIKEFPIKSYNQTHKIKPIETYRLEGLTYSSFLKKEINLWNFRGWVDMFYKTLNGNIREIRYKIDSTENILMSSIKKFENKYEFSKKINQTKINPKILFKIGKYDYNSVIVDLFNYQEASLNFLEYAQSDKNNINSKENFILKKRAKYYYDLLNKKIYADSLQKLVKRKINKKSTEKYRDFINSNFENTTGFKAYIIKQNINNNTNYKKYLNNLKYFMYKDFDKNQQDSVVVYRKYNIPLKIGIDTISKNIKTKSLSFDGNGNLYVTGSVIESGYEKGFVSLVNNYEVKWFKTFSNKSNSKNTIIVKANNNGCFAVFSSIEDEEISNKIVRFDIKGKKQLEEKLEYNSVVRYLNYDDINEKLLLSFYGDSINKNSIKKTTLKMAKYSVKNSEIEMDWTDTVKINFLGSFVDIAKINQNYYVFANYNEYTDLNNNKVKVKGTTSISQNNTLLVILNKNGQKVSMKNFSTRNSYYLTKAVKINNNLINLMGIYDDIDKANTYIEKKQGKFFYMLIDNRGNVIYE